MHQRADSPSSRRPRSRLAAALLLPVALLATPGAGAQTFAAGSQPEALPQPTATLAQRIEAARSAIEVFQARLDSFDTPAAAPPPGIPAEEAQLSRSIAERSVMVAEFRLRDLETLSKAIAARKQAEAAASAWTGFEAEPPYSILLADDVAAKHTAATVRAAILAASEQGIAARVENFVDAAKEARQAANRAAEAAELASAAERAVAEWRREFANQRANLSAVAVEWTQVARELSREQRAQAVAEVALLDRQMQALDGQTVFESAHLDEALVRLNARIGNLEHEYQEVTRSARTLARERRAAEQALAAAQATAGGDVPEASNRERALQLVMARLESMRTRAESLAVLLMVRKAAIDSWRARYILLNDPDAGKRGIAARTLESLVTRGRFILHGVEAEVEAGALAERELSESALALETDEISRTHARELLRAARDARASRERVMDAVANVTATIERWIRDADVSRTGLPLRERLEHVRAAGVAMLDRAWQFELFAVEDTFTIGDETVTTSRPVTVAKVVTALFVLVTGMWLTTRLTRRLERTLVRRFEIGDDQARAMLRWFTSGVFILLLIFCLYIVRIPLTIFAFLGGALAIGLGFGSQTLIKNLVSGILLLLERRIRPGDIVEVEGVTGRVVAVDIRSSTVRGFDGVEALIPNSLFLEQRVTNWTLSSRRLLRSVKVGVAYGTATRVVSNLLLQCAKDHAEVLAEPAPVVRFEDFGADSLHFKLFYWVEILDHDSGVRVSSDIRYAIDEAFAREGIVIAYPQRDVHVDASTPLRVEIVAPAGQAASPGAA